MRHLRNQIIQQSKLEIDFDRTFLNGINPVFVGNLTIWRFGISKPLNIHYFELLSKITEHGQKKLDPKEVREASFGKSAHNHY